MTSETFTKDNEARRLVGKAIGLWIEIGYSEEEIAEFVSEIYSDEAGSTTSTYVPGRPKRTK